MSGKHPLLNGSRGLVAAIVATMLSMSVLLTGQSPQVTGQAPLPPGSASETPRDGARQPRGDRSAPGTAQIRGTVRAADTGAPLWRASVRLGSAQGETYTARTDVNGAYELNGVRAGSYQLQVIKAGYLPMSYRQRRPEGVGRPLVVADGALLERVDIRLPRGGVIAGRVLDEFGEPVLDADVTALEGTSLAAGAVAYRRPVRGARTNDAGEFRLFGLPPGEYVLSAALRASPDDVHKDGYAPTFFPGVADPSAAQPLRVRAGATVSDAVIPLVATTTARISGTVVGVTGRPLSSGFVEAVPRSGSLGPLPTIALAMVRADGSFELVGVPPGGYVLRARIAGQVMLGSEAPSVAEVVVSGEDVSGVRLEPVSRAKLTGSVVFLGPAPSPTLIERIALQIQPMVGVYLGNHLSELKILPDGTFEVSLWPGRVRLVARVPRVPGDGEWSVRIVRRGSVDVTDTGIEVTSGDNIRDVVIEFTTVRSELRGVVTDEQGRLLADYTVVVFARDPQRWEGFSRYVAVGGADDAGRFRITGLPPEEYEAVAVDSLDPNRARTLEFLDSVRGTGTLFSLTEGEARELSLRLADPTSR